MIVLIFKSFVILSCWYRVAPIVYRLPLGSLFCFLSAVNTGSVQLCEIKNTGSTYVRSAGEDLTLRIVLPSVQQTVCEHVPEEQRQLPPGSAPAPRAFLLRPKKSVSLPTRSSSHSPINPFQWQNVPKDHRPNPGSLQAHSTIPNHRARPTEHVNKEAGSSTVPPPNILPVGLRLTKRENDMGQRTGKEDNGWPRIG
jgi:hypothetical protein